jgi:hypothetical protein
MTPRCVRLHARLRREKSHALRRPSVADAIRHDIECTGWQVECWGDAGRIKARLFYRGDQFGPEFEARTPRAIAAAVARYLAEVAASLEGDPQ